MRHVTASEKETFALAKKMAQTLKGGEVIALYGDLGAGKTVFAKGIAAGLGIKQDVTSPTFTLMNVYPVKKGGVSRLVHIDCYRLKDALELEAIGVREYLGDPNTITLIEWAERAKSLLTADTITVRLVVANAEQRRITINHHGKF